MGEFKIKPLLVYLLFIVASTGSAKLVHSDGTFKRNGKFMTIYPKATAQIVRYEYKHLPENGYSMFYETSDGQIRYEYGYFQDKAEGPKVLNVRGFYGFYDDKGKKHFLRYSSNEKGFLYSEGEPFFDSSHGPPTVQNTLFGKSYRKTTGISSSKAAT